MDGAATTDPIVVINRETIATATIHRHLIIIDSYTYTVCDKDFSVRSRLAAVVFAHLANDVWVGGLVGPFLSY